MRKERAFPRLKRRINCAVRVHGCEHPGIVRDLSPGGFFVQTPVAPAIGAQVWVTLRQADGSSIPLVAEVTNRRSVPRQLNSLMPAGLGCKLQLLPPEEYFQLLGALDGR